MIFLLFCSLSVLISLLLFPPFFFSLLFVLLSCVSGGKVNTVPKMNHFCSSTSCWTTQSVLLLNFCGKRADTWFLSLSSYLLYFELCLLLLHFYQAILLAFFFPLFLLTSSFFVCLFLSLSLFLLCVSLNVVFFRLSTGYCFLLRFPSAATVGQQSAWVDGKIVSLFFFFFLYTCPFFLFATE